MPWTPTHSVLRPAPPPPLPYGLRGKDAGTSTGTSTGWALLLLTHVTGGREKKNTFAKSCFIMSTLKRRPNLFFLQLLDGHGTGQTGLWVEDAGGGGGDMRALRPDCEMGEDRDRDPCAGLSSALAGTYTAEGATGSNRFTVSASGGNVPAERAG